jgi:hypothetical protein
MTTGRKRHPPYDVDFHVRMQSNSGNRFALRCLFRLPTSMVTRQVDNGVIETGWAINPDGQPEAHDGHKTIVYQTKGGTVAQYHDYNADNLIGALPLIRGKYQLYTLLRRGR